MGRFSEKWVWGCRENEGYDGNDFAWIVIDNGMQLPSYDAWIEELSRQEATKEELGYGLIGALMMAEAFRRRRQAAGVVWGQLCLLFDD